MRCVRPSDIFRQKSTSRAKEPVGNYSYRTRSRSVRNPSRCFAKRYSFGQSVGTSCKTTLLPSYTTCFFSSIEVHVVAWLAQREDSRWEFQDGTLGGGGGGGFWAPQLTQNILANTAISYKKSPIILTRQSAESKSDVIPQPLLSRSNLEQITRK